jgi:hypothetical protein
MKANEFRIGNIVDYLGSPTIINSISGIEETYVSTRKSGIMPINAFKPIPLTEDWLLKCGFEKDEKNEYWFWKKCVSVSVLGYIELLSFNRQSFKTNIQLQYIHQLQNFYFALTGEELVVSDIVNETLQQNTVSCLNCPTCNGDSWMQNLIQSEKKYCKCGAIF